MKKIICGLISGIMLMQTMVFAKEWVNLSSWAYNDVSVFTSEGLLPESFEGISDYTESITRLQFSELLYSIGIKSKKIRDNSNSVYFNDCDAISVNKLYSNNIVHGIVTEKKEYEPDVISFFPDNTIARQEAAMILNSAYDSWVRYYPEESTELLYSEGVSTWAQESVFWQRNLGIMDGTYLPHGTMTIEEAIVAALRLYRKLPVVPPADGAGISADTETLVKTYESGLRETKLNNSLRIMDGDACLMTFDTDLYSYILQKTINDKRLAMAGTYSNRTEVYSLDTGELLFTIPYLISFVDNDYIYTKSDTIGPLTFGAYNYSGSELLPCVYSFLEVEQIINNNFTIPKPTYRPADGWIYYADWSDYGHMYKIDSNGENKQKLSDDDCFNIVYYDGWLYYSKRGADENKLFCMKSDGTHETRFTDCYSYLIQAQQTAWDKLDGWCTSSTTSNLVAMNGFVYYVERDEETGKRTLFRIKPDDSGVVLEKVLAVDFQSIPNTYFDNGAQFYDDKLYFIDTDTKALYYTDGTELKCVSSDLPVDSWWFFDNLLMIESGDKLYSADTNGENLVLYEDQSIKESSHGKQDYSYPDNCSDDENTVFWYRDYDSGIGGLFVENNGEVKTISTNFMGIFRIKNSIYYTESGLINKLCAYDLKSGETKVVLEDYYETSSLAYGDNWLIYIDNSSNTMRLNLDTGKSDNVYPCKGINPYGEVLKMLLYNGMVKIDTQGNYTVLNAANAHYASYIPNGDKRAARFY